MDSDLYVAVKPEYIKPRVSAESSKKCDPAPVVIENETESTVVEVPGSETSNVEATETPLNENNKRKIDEVQGAKNSGKTKLTLKQRHQETHPQKDERLCSFIGRGDICPYEGKCQYNHDIFDYLSKKPADIGPVCYLYESFGYCPGGFMCRFADSHIDRSEPNKPINKRKEHIIERVLINTLSKDAQLLLRKKNFDKVHFPHIKSSYNNRNEEKKVAAAVTVTAPQPKEENENEDIEKEEDMAEGTEAQEQQPVPVVVTTTKEPEPFNSTPYPEKEIKRVDFRNKIYIAPLTTVGNLPFRRVIKDYGADITCGEMAMSQNILNGQASEWALLRRHQGEDVYGVQIAGNHPDMMGRVARVLEKETKTDFVDLNCGCPIDVVCNRGAGSSLMTKHSRLTSIVKALADNLPSRSITVKVRTGWDDKHPTTHKLIPHLQQTVPGRIAAIMIHGRSRLQRYHKLADWDYILRCAQSQDPTKPLVPIIGNGDIFSWEDWEARRTMMSDEIISNATYENNTELLGLTSCAMLGRGVLIKPWLPKELKEKQTYDISASERLEMLQRFCNYGLEHWGSDQQGVNTTRRFLLEWLSFLHRYVPVGVVEYGQRQRMNQRPPHYFGRCDLETLLSSTHATDWTRISEMLLGPVHDSFSFIAKHKSNSYAPESEDLMNG